MGFIPFGWFGFDIHCNNFFLKDSTFIWGIYSSITKMTAKFLPGFNIRAVGVFQGGVAYWIYVYLDFSGSILFHFWVIFIRIVKLIQEEPKHLSMSVCDFSEELVFLMEVSLEGTELHYSNNSQDLLQKLRDNLLSSLKRSSAGMLGYRRA